MSDKVVAFEGATIPGEPVEEVVRMIEGLLEEAKAGRIVGIVASTAHLDGTTSSWWDYSAGQQFLTGFGLSSLFHEFFSDVRENHTEKTV